GAKGERLGVAGDRGDLQGEAQLAHHVSSLVRRDYGERVVAAGDGGAGRVETVPAQVEAVADGADVQRAQRAAVLARDRGAHDVEGAGVEPPRESFAAGAELRVGCGAGGDGGRGAADSGEQGDRLRGKSERVRTVARVDEHEPARRGPRGVGPAAEQLDGGQVHERGGALGPREGSGSLERDRAPDEPSGDVQVQVLVGANPLTHEVRAGLGGGERRHSERSEEDEKQRPPHGASGSNRKSVFLVFTPAVIVTVVTSRLNPSSSSRRRWLPGERR